MRKITRIIVHCSASDYKNQNAAWIDKIHREERGFRKIGYHYFITHQGKVEVGRQVHEIGAHCKGYNSNSIGVCVAGNEIFSVASLQALEKVLKSLRQQFPDATIHGHREFNPGKTCPNFNMERFKKL